VICLGDEISAYINDEELTTVNDDSFAEGYIGTMAATFDESDLHVAFDRIGVEAIE